MRLVVAAPITAALVVVGAGIAVTSRRPVEASALWVAVLTLVLLLSALFAHVRAARRAAHGREKRAERDLSGQGKTVRRGVGRKELSTWKS